MKRRYTKDMLQEAATVSKSVAEMMRYFGFRSYSGASSTLIRTKLAEYGIDTSHFSGWRTSVGKRPANRRSASDVLVKRAFRREDSHRLRRALVEAGVPYVCSECGLGPRWNGQELVLHVDHKNGDGLDCRQGNLRFLCPNCHSQTPSWGRKGRD